jgi:hypothetical protein
MRSGYARHAVEADVVVIDDSLTPVQQRNLEKAWNAKVIDRTGLILEIFGRRARTKPKASCRSNWRGWTMSARAWSAPGPTWSASAAAPARPAARAKPRSNSTAA